MSRPLRTLSMNEVSDDRTGTAHTQAVKSVCFGRTEDRVVSGGVDGMWLSWAAIAREESSIRAWHATVIPSTHDEGVNGVCVSPDGTMAASAGRDDKVYIGDLRAEAKTVVLKGHVGDATSVAFSPDGRLLASTGEDHTVRLWDVSRGAAAADLQGHMQPVSCVGFSPSGSQVLSMDTHTVRVWDLPTGLCVAELDNAHDVLGTGVGAYAGAGAGASEGAGSGAGGSLLYADFLADTDWLLTVDAGGVKAWNTLSGHCLTWACPAAASLQSAVLSSDRSKLLLGTAVGQVQEWTLPKLIGTPLDKQTLELREAGSYLSRHLSHPVLSVVLSISGKFIAAGDDDGVVCVWSRDSKESVLTERHGQGLYLQTQVSAHLGVTSMCFLTSTRDKVPVDILVTCCKSTGSLDVKDLSEPGGRGPLRRLVNRDCFLNPGEAPDSAFVEKAVPCGGTRVLCAVRTQRGPKGHNPYYSVVVWDVETNSVMSRVQHHDPVVSIRRTVAAETLEPLYATGDADGIVQVWRQGGGIAAPWSLLAVLGRSRMLTFNDASVQGTFVSSVSCKSILEQEGACGTATVTVDSSEWRAAKSRGQDPSDPARLGKLQRTPGVAAPSGGGGAHSSTLGSAAERTTPPISGDVRATSDVWSQPHDTVTIDGSKVSQGTSRGATHNTVEVVEEGILSVGYCLSAGHTQYARRNATSFWCSWPKSRCVLSHYLIHSSVPEHT